MKKKWIYGNKLRLVVVGVATIAKSMVITANDQVLKVNSSGVAKISGKLQKENTLGVTLIAPEKESLRAISTIKESSEGDLLPMTASETTKTTKKCELVVVYDETTNKITNRYPERSILIGKWNRQNKVGILFEVSIEVDNYGEGFISVKRTAETAHLVNGEVFFPAFGQRISKFFATNLFSGSSELNTLPSILDYDPTFTALTSTILNTGKLPENTALLFETFPAIGEALMATDTMEIATVPIAEILNNNEALPRICWVSYSSLKKASTGTLNALQSYFGRTVHFPKAVEVAVLEEVPME